MDIDSIINSFVRKWPLIILLALAGFGFAYLYANQHPPQYEAHVKASFGLNYDRDTPLRQREQDLAETKVIQYLVSEEMIAEALLNLDADLQSDESHYALPEMNTTIRLERRISDFVLIVVGEEPEFILALANAWAEVIEQAFPVAYSHALQANAIEQQIKIANYGIVQMNASNVPPAENDVTISQTERLIEELVERLAQEIELSHGVASFISFEINSDAYLYEVPVTYGRAGLLFSGTGIGILTGLLVILATAQRYRPGADESDAPDRNGKSKNNV